MKKIKYLLVLLILIVGSMTFLGYKYIFDSNVGTDIAAFFIEPESSYLDVKEDLIEMGIIRNAASFNVVAKWMNYDQPLVPTGKYRINKGMSNRELIGMLRAGRQVPVNVTFNNARKIENLAGTLAPYFYVDSITLLQELTNDSFLLANQVTLDNVMTLFIPNTYQMFWDYPQSKILDRLIIEKEKFWKKKNRLVRAEQIGLTPIQIYTLASIVEKESNHKPERPRIAGLYINRIKRGIPLQADPTVVFATGLFDLKRVLKKHLEFDSPFNTYKYPGIPPGPITMPSINSIDAVLNYEEHNYIYMCAKPGYGTKHAFAETHRQHEINANRYRSWLNSEGIR